MSDTRAVVFIPQNSRRICANLSAEPVREIFNLPVSFII